MFARSHRQGSWTKGVLTLLAALAVAWAMLAAPALAVPISDGATNMQACCPHAARIAGGDMSGSMKMDHPCDSELGCPSPDCSMTAGSVTAGTLDGYYLALPGSGLETRRQMTSSRPRNFAFPIPKQPPRT